MKLDKTADFETNLETLLDGVEDEELTALIRERTDVILSVAEESTRSRRKPFSEAVEELIEKRVQALEDPGEEGDAQ